jgi:hypothetical protein
VVIYDMKMKLFILSLYLVIYGCDFSEQTDRSYKSYVIKDGIVTNAENLKLVKKYEYLQEVEFQYVYKNDTFIGLYHYKFPARTFRSRFRSGDSIKVAIHATDLKDIFLYKRKFRQLPGYKLVKRR